MTHRQDCTERKCEICQKLIEEGQWMIDLFRQESAQPSATVRMCWVHENCGRSAIEVWLKKKWSKNSETNA
jgi:hypothetical protein